MHMAPWEARGVEMASACHELLILPLLIHSFVVSSALPSCRLDCSTIRNINAYIRRSTRISARFERTIVCLKAILASSLLTCAEGRSFSRVLVPLILQV